MTILEQIAARLNEHPPHPNAVETAREMIEALCDTPWNLPHSSGAIESVCKETIRKHVLEEK